MLELLSSMPGFSPKYGLEMLCQDIISKVGHPVDKFEFRLGINHDILESLVEHKGKQGLSGIVYPPQYNHAGKSLVTMFGKEEIPTHCHVYSQPFPKEGKVILMDMLAEYAPNVKSTIDFVVIKVDRNKSEFPFTLYYQDDGKKMQHSGVIK